LSLSDLPRAKANLIAIRLVARGGTDAAAAVREALAHGANAAPGE